MTELARIEKYLENKRFNMALPFVKGKLLDIGCGRNRFTKAYHGEGLGLDVFDWGDVDVLVEDSTKIPFPDKSFDTITILGALGHTKNPKGVLKEANRLLKDDGRIVFTNLQPTISVIWHYLRRHHDEDQLVRGIHEGEKLGHTFNEVIELLSETGFHLEYRTKFNLGVNDLFVGSPIRSDQRKK